MFNAKWEASDCVDDYAALTISETEAESNFPNFKQNKCLAMVGDWFWGTVLSCYPSHIRKYEESKVTLVQAIWTKTIEILLKLNELCDSANPDKRINSESYQFH